MTFLTTKPPDRFEVTSGNNWRIERNFITSEFADEVCREIGTLATLSQVLPLGIVTDRPLVFGEGVSGYRCLVGLEPLQIPVGANLKDHPEELIQIPRMLELFDLSRKTIGSMVPGFAINILEPSGSIEKHADAYNFPSSAVTLSGVSLTAIEDPITHEVHVFELAKGDRFVIQNPYQGLHPKHEVVNATDSERTAFVI